MVFLGNGVDLKHHATFDNLMWTPSNQVIYHRKTHKPCGFKFSKKSIIEKLKRKRTVERDKPEQIYLNYSPSAKITIINTIRNFFPSSKFVAMTIPILYTNETNIFKF